MVLKVDDQELAREMVFDPQGRWWNCYSNLLNEVTKDFLLPKSVIVKDETLREGLTVPGRKRLEMSGLLEMAAALEEAGFTQMEVGFTGAIDEHREIAKMYKREGIKIKHSAHTRTYVKDWKAEIDRVIDAGADIVNLVASGTAEKERYAVPAWMTKEELPELYRKEVEYCKSQGVFSAFLVSTNVTRLDLLDSCYRAVSEGGVNRAYIGDSYGSGIPEATKYLVKHLRGIVGPGVEIGVHLHNDFGFATANAIAAVTAGANVVDASVNGLGDRAGIPTTDEVVAVLEVLYGVRTGIKLDKLRSLSKLVEKHWGFPVSPLKPVIGENMFRHETSSHIAAALSGLWYAFNVIKPSVLASKVSLEFGSASLVKGEWSAVGQKLRTMGLKANDQQFDKILDLIREEMKGSPQNFATEEKVEEIIRHVVK